MQKPGGYGAYPSAHLKRTTMTQRTERIFSLNPVGSKYLFAKSMHILLYLVLKSRSWLQAQVRDSHRGFRLGSLMIPHVLIFYIIFYRYFVCCFFVRSGGDRVNFPPHGNPPYPSADISGNVIAGMPGLTTRGAKTTWKQLCLKDPFYSDLLSLIVLSFLVYILRSAHPGCGQSGSSRPPTR